MLCAYLRLPYEAEPEPEASEQERLSFRANREVRHTVIRVSTGHLKQGAAVSWQGSNLDFTGVVFDGGCFSGVSFSAGIVSFSRAVFSGGQVDFFQAEFSGGTVKFRGARFSGGTTSFHMATFSGAEVDFGDLGWLAGSVRPGRDDLLGGAEFSGGQVGFDMASFSGGRVRFSGASFSGATVRFRMATFSGAEVDFRRPSDWPFPPAFPWTGTPPPGVELPEKIAPAGEAREAAGQRRIAPRCSAGDARFARSALRMRSTTESSSVCGAG